MRGRLTFATAGHNRGDRRRTAGRQHSAEIESDRWLAAEIAESLARRGLTREEGGLEGLPFLVPFFLFDSFSHFYLLLCFLFPPGLLSSCFFVLGVYSKWTITVSRRRFFSFPRYFCVSFFYRHYANEQVRLLSLLAMQQLLL